MTFLPFFLRGSHYFFPQTYSMSVYLVRQLTSPLLLQRLRMKGIRNPDHSRALSEICFFYWKVLIVKKKKKKPTATKLGWIPVIAMFKHYFVAV